MSERCVAESHINEARLDMRKNTNGIWNPIVIGFSKDSYRMDSNHHETRPKAFRTTQPSRFVGRNVIPVFRFFLHRYSKSRIKNE